MMEKKFVEILDEEDLTYLWGGISTAFLEKLRDRNTPIFREKFNGMMAASKEILDNVYEKIGKPAAHGLTDSMVEREKAQLNLVDYIFVANPIAADQYARFGVDPKKIIRSSYGWDPRRVQFAGAKAVADSGVTVVFVGVAAIRKGTDLLLRAWCRAGIKGRLIIAGPVADDIASDHADLLARPDVVVTGWRDDVAAIYASADIFTFPSHDEGGPLVTYEAMGCGLPVIVSPIGAGAIARHGKDGFVIDPFDTQGWVDALRKLAADAELRRFMGETARQRAQEFTWDKVGARRRQDVLERL